MLIAYNEFGKMISADDVDINNESFYCVSCKEPLILKRGSIKVNHFAHQRGSDCSSFSEGETSEHLIGKKQLFNFFKFSNPILEHYFNNLKQRPDILLENNLIIEFQCSPISNKRLLERLSGYHSINHQSIWILGLPYLKRNNSYKKLKQFLRYNRKLGFYLLYWDFKREQMEIHHHVRLIIGKLDYQIKFISNFQEFKIFINQDIKGNIDINFKMLNDRLVNRIKAMQNSLIYNQNRLDSIQNLCYENGFNIVGYPILLDFPIIEAPIMGKKLIQFKIVMLIYLKIYRSVKISDLINKVNAFIGIDQHFCMIDNSVINYFILRILSFWDEQGVVNLNQQSVILKQMPNWYASYDLKIAALLDKKGN